MEPESNSVAAPRSQRTRARARAWVTALVGIGLAWSPMWLPPILRTAGADPRPLLAAIGLAGPAASILWNLLATALVLAWVFGVERSRLTSLRIVRPTGKDLEWALILFGGAMTWSWLAQLIRPQAAPDSGSATIAALPVLTVVAMILSAAICEEILFRGYPLERLTQLTGRRWVAVATTLPFFVVPHLFTFGIEWLLSHASGTVAIYALYLWRRNLVACMVLHAAVNAPILIPTVAAHLR
ncbi:CPBP family intramembrane glutamic endopeptidase [Microbacterium arborescens]|uniref:CPBP family intramembrane glutamic endopeptidase n=1 Tax=Microbacterium arborescens TaxID=33883 RepID=UPI00277D2453|nr:type II CAAX endopeptidase family protein [Microbacterium arborescens]MDQ1217713.1 membrane protease YdiL (CAAX protease family) [Microbacterium arborescens]